MGTRKHSVVGVAVATAAVIALVATQAHAAVEIGGIAGAHVFSRIGATLWATFIALDNDAVWGAVVTATVGVAIVIGAAWLSTAPILAKAPALPRAISLPLARLSRQRARRSHVSIRNRRVDYSP
jgi:hypothetical protein